jgi:hypothetical protein
MTPPLRSLRACFEGAVPSTIATCSAEGIPNVAKLSHVHYVDDQHVALSYQFFNKTRENILANSRAIVEVVDPTSAAHYQLKLTYLRTETEGPRFEYMKARLAAIASHSGMSKVFRLLGADIYQVTHVFEVPGWEPAESLPRASLLSGLRACLSQCHACTDLERLLDVFMEGLAQHWGVDYAMLLMLDPDGRRLYTVASRGYPESGIGSEVCIGEGVVGVAARERTAIRIGYAVQEYRYSNATRERFAASDDVDALETLIPFPGLAEAGSQLAVPLQVGSRLLGVLLLESVEEQRFTFEDEDAMLILADQVALCIDALSRAADQSSEPATPAAADPPAARLQGAVVQVRHFRADRSVFVENDYLIKGVAGAILWKLLREFVETGRTEFTNRELRLDSTLGLPDVTDNLDARLILLQRRLAERCGFLAIEKTGRGRFRLTVDRPLQLNEAAPG